MKNSDQICSESVIGSFLLISSEAARMNHNLIVNVAIFCQAQTHLPMLRVFNRFAMPRDPKLCLEAMRTALLRRNEVRSLQV